MKILAIGFIYNELSYLPELIKYYQNQGCELYLIDNCSHDGTFNYLKKNNIHCSQFNTNESFNLDTLQFETNKIIHKIKPDWILYIAGDLYMVFEKTIKETIIEAESNGFNQISAKCYGFLNTGEHHNTPLYKNYFHAMYYKRLTFISKYHESLKLDGDNILIENINSMASDGLVLNYGGCKTKEEQELKLKRSAKAWEEGMRIGIGRHLRKAKEHQWTWSRKMAKSIDKLPDYELINKFIREN